MNRLMLTLTIIVTITVAVSSPAEPLPSGLRQNLELQVRQRDSLLFEEHEAARQRSAATSNSRVDVQNEVDISLAGSALWAYAEDIDVQGDYAYCILRYGLVILDISDLVNPRYVSRLELAGGYERRVAVEGDFAYITDWDGYLTIVNVGAPESPTLVAAPSLGKWSKDIAVVDSLAYLLSSYSLEILSVANPQSPTLLGSCAASYASAAAVEDSLAYVAFYRYSPNSGGIQIIDVSDPHAPSVVGTCSTTSRTDRLVVADSLVYATTRDSGLQIFNVANTRAPFLTGKCYSDTLRWLTDVIVADTLAYLTGDGLIVVNVANPQVPHLVSALFDFPLVFTPEGLVMKGDHVLLADLQDIPIINVTNPSDPYLTGSYDMGLVQDVRIAANYAYIADAYRGLRICDISDPQEPAEVGGCITGGAAYGVAVEDSFAYVADGKLCVVDIADPRTPSLLGICLTWGYASQVALADTIVYVAEWGGNVEAVSVADPRFPYVVGRYPSSHYDSEFPSGIAVRDTLVFFADGDSGVQIISVADPTTPYRVGNYMSHGAMDLAVVDTLMYLAVHDSGLMVVNIADPAAPYLVGTCKSSYCYSVIALGAYVYLGGANLEIINVSDPQAPYVAGTYDTPWLVQGVAASGGYAYVADWVGFLVLQVETPMCGDADGDGAISIGDAVYLVNYIFADGPAPSPLTSGDADCDQTINIADVVYLVTTSSPAVQRLAQDANLESRGSKP